MSRRLDETRIGEYKTLWGLNFIYMFIWVAGIVGLFLLPTFAFESEGETTFLSPVNYLLKNPGWNFTTYSAIAFIGLFAVIFFNSFICLSTKLGKNVFVKISKVFEILLTLAVMAFYQHILFHSGVSQSELPFAYAWVDGCVALALFQTMILFATKKVSIYD